jgi:hypothetical protein
MKRHFSQGSKNRLTRYDRKRFSPYRLFGQIGLVLCRVGKLPRKELYEAWEVARRARRLFRGGRVVDMAGGHGLLAHIMLLLDRSSPSAIVVDTNLPDSTKAVHEALATAWPFLAERVTFVSAGVDEVELSSTDVVVSSHACGALTDRVLARAVEARARVAVLPCCHDKETCDPGPLAAWMRVELAIDAGRAVRLGEADYRVWAQVISNEITVMNRLILGQPREFKNAEPARDQPARGPGIRLS